MEEVSFQRRLGMGWHRHSQGLEEVGSLGIRRDLAEAAASPFVFFLELCDGVFDVLRVHASPFGSRSFLSTLRRLT